MTHFGLRTEPFALTPDPSFLYLSPDHAESLAALRIGIEGRRGLMAMIAEVGMGKTTLLYTLLSEMGPGTQTAYVANTKLPFDSLLRQALADFGVATNSRDRVTLLRALNRFLQESAIKGSTAALVIDEAQNLDDDTFENLRLLSNFESYDSKLLQIVLVGQPELELKLRQPQLRQIAERIAVRCHINPLNDAESRRYIDHRLSCAGGSSTALFTPGALRSIVRKARGIPRRINILAHNALLFAYGRGEARVSRPVARAAVREREGRGLVTIGPRRPAKPAKPPLGARIATAAGPVWKRLRQARPRRAMSLAATIAIAVSVGWLVTRPDEAHLETQLDRGRVVPAQGADLADESSPPEAVTAVAYQSSEPLGPPAQPIARAADEDRTNATTGEPPHAPSKAVPNAPSKAVPSDDEHSVDRQEARAVDRSRESEASRQPPPLPQQRTTLSGYMKIRITRTTSLRALLREIYGNDSPALVRRVRQANPQLDDLNELRAGTRLQVPEPRTRAAR